MKGIKFAENAIAWFREMSLEEQYYVAIKNNHLILGDKSRYPSALTVREIQALYSSEEEVSS